MPRYDDDDEDDFDDRPRRRKRREDDDDEYDRPRSRSRRRDEDEDDEYDDRPRRRRQPEGNPAAATSLTLGLLSILLNVLTGIPAVVFGIIGLRRAGQSGPGRGMAVSGIVSAVVGVALSSVGIYFFWTAREERQVGHRTVNNAKQLGIGMHSFHDMTGTFPAAYTTVPGARVGINQPPPPDQRLMSWRTAILPYVEQGPLFQAYDQQQPWNGPRNRPVTDTVVMTYLNGPERTNQTRFAVFTGPNTPFPHGQRPLNLARIVDGSSNTILIAESAALRPWGEPADLEVSPNAPMPQLGDPARPSYIVLMADGSVRQVRRVLDDRTLRLLVDPSDGQVVPFDW